MHGNTKDARKWSGQAVLLVMPGWIMNSFGSFIFSYAVIKAVVALHGPPWVPPGVAVQPTSLASSVPR